MGSLISLWMKELTDGTHLWLLGRSGRGSWEPSSAGDCLVTLARSDVSVIEEADYIIQAAGQQKRLQVALLPNLFIQRIICDAAAQNKITTTFIHVKLCQCILKTDDLSHEVARSNNIRT